MKRLALLLFVLVCLASACNSAIQPPPTPPEAPTPSAEPKQTAIFTSAPERLASVTPEREAPTSPTPKPTLQPSVTPTLASASATPLPTPAVPTSSKLATPPNSFLYNGIFLGSTMGEVHDPTLADLRSYEQTVGKQAVWVYFQHDWFRGRAFPLATATWIREAGSVPYIRLMLRSDAEQNHADPLYTLDHILRGDFDADLHAWARAAHEFGSPLIAEYGTEVNGEWVPWNGKWNGTGTLNGYGDPAAPDGSERFRDAYRHVIQIGREEKADNLTWVFHVNNQDIPDEAWNHLEAYYPGDEWIDWLGVSVYGAQTPMDQDWPSFRDLMDAVYPRLAALAPNKPIALLEFGAAAHNPHGDQAQWADAALADLTAQRWPRLIGFSWWNEAWPNDNNPNHNTNMRIQDNPTLAQVFQVRVGREAKVLGRPVLANPAPAAATPATATLWKPTPNTTWQWQLAQLPVDPSVEAGVYDIDLFDNEAAVVAALHAQGRQVICYLSAGSWEEWRPDKDQFPKAVIGKDYRGWKGEKWLDIRQIEQLTPVMRARLDQCRAKGFDAIEPDNLDGYTNDTGFPLTDADQLKYNRWLAEEAHARGLSIGLKNDPDQAADLEPFFDWALTEDCFDQGWCEQMRPFLDAGKAVFAAEYTDTGISLGQFCPQAKTLNISAILKHRDLDAWRVACP